MQLSQAHDQSQTRANSRGRDLSPSLDTSKLRLPSYDAAEEPSFKPGSCHCQPCRKKQRLFE